MRAVAAIVAPAVPSMADILALPVAQRGAYEVAEADVRVVRSRIYTLNQKHARGWKWRTACLPSGRRGTYNLIVWRVR